MKPKFCSSDWYTFQASLKSNRESPLVKYNIWRATPHFVDFKFTLAQWSLTLGKNFQQFCSSSLGLQGEIGLNAAHMVMELVKDNRKIVDRITHAQIDNFVDLLRKNKVSTTVLRPRTGIRGTTGVRLQPMQLKTSVRLSPCFPLRVFALRVIAVRSFPQNYRYLDLLSVLCVCDGVSIPDNQTYITEAWLKQGQKASDFSRWSL